VYTRQITKTNQQTNNTEDTKDGQNEPHPKTG